MDDFRVGSISQYEPYRDDQPGDRAREKKQRRQKDPAFEEDGFESTVEQVEAEAEGAEPQDYYTPSEQKDE